MALPTHATKTWPSRPECLSRSPGISARTRQPVRQTVTMTAPRWSAERLVTVALVADLLARAVPELAGASLAPLGEGWDNTVLLADEQWALRFPRRAVALPGIRREIAVLPALAPLLPLRVPVAEFVAMDAHPDDSWPFTGARLIAGRELAQANLSDAARGPMASAMGAFLRTLHGPAPRAVAAAAAELPVDPMQRGWPAGRSTWVRVMLSDLVEAGVWTRDRSVTDLLDDADELGPPTDRPTLVHGDLHVRHVLVDASGAVTGVIDWGDLCLADPAVDLALAYAAFLDAPRRAFFSAYGPVARERELRARSLAICLSAMLAGYAAREVRPALLAEALAGLSRAVR